MSNLYSIAGSLTMGHSRIRQACVQCDLKRVIEALRAWPLLPKSPGVGSVLHLLIPDLVVPIDGRTKQPLLARNNCYGKRMPILNISEPHFTPL